MRTGFSILVLFIAGTLASSSVACPLWVVAMNTDMQQHHPCSEETQHPENCPPSICAAASPYLTADARSSQALQPQELPAEEPHESSKPVLARAALNTHQDWIPPGWRDPLFLHIRVLLI